MCLFFMATKTHFLQFQPKYVSMFYLYILCFIGTQLLSQKPLNICKGQNDFFIAVSYYHLLLPSSLSNRSAVDSTAIDTTKFKKNWENIIKFYQNLESKRDSHTLSHFAGKRVEHSTISHIFGNFFKYTQAREKCWVTKKVEK